MDTGRRSVKNKSDSFFFFVFHCSFDMGGWKWERQMEFCWTQREPSGKNLPWISIPSERLYINYCHSEQGFGDLAGAVIRKYLEPEGVLGIIRMGDPNHHHNPVGILIFCASWDLCYLRMDNAPQKEGKATQRWQIWPEMCNNFCNKEKSYKIVPLT